MSDHSRKCRELLADHATRLLRRVWDDQSNLITLIEQAEQTIRLARAELDQASSHAGVVQSSVNS